MLLGDPQIVPLLQIEPEVGGGAQELAEQERGLAGHRGFLLGDALEAGARDVGALRESAGGNVQRLEELLAENLAGMHRCQLSAQDFPRCDGVLADQEWHGNGSCGAAGKDEARSVNTRQEAT